MAFSLDMEQTMTSGTILPVELEERSSAVWCKINHSRLAQRGRQGTCDVEENPELQEVIW